MKTYKDHALTWASKREGKVKLIVEMSKAAGDTASEAYEKALYILSPAKNYVKMCNKLVLSEIERQGLKD